MAEVGKDKEQPTSLIAGLRKTPIISSLVKAAEWTLTGSRFDPSSEQYREALLVSTFSLALSPWGAFYATWLVVLGSPRPAIGIYILTVFSYLTPVLLRKTGSVNIAAHYLCSTIYLAILLVVGFNGGRGAPGWEWAVAMPTMASLMMGRKGGWIWTVLGVGIVVGFDLGVSFGVEWPKDLHGQKFTMLRLSALMGLVFVVYSLGLLYEYLKNIAMLELSSAKQKAEEARESAEEAANVKSQFLANMSHEIRTPMAGVIGMTELLRETEFDDEQHEQLETIHSAAQSLLRVINDILVYSKVDAGKVELEESSFNVRDELAQIEQLFRIQVYAKDLVYVTEVFDGVPQYLIGDPYRLRQVLVNLIGNAVKFSRVGGAVVVGVDMIANIGATASIRFFVSDTGIGIEKSKQEEIFEAFSQADVKVPGKYGGTGLGLSISSKLVHLMGGSLNVSSKAGIGAVFSFAGTFGRFDTDDLSDAAHEAVPLPKLERYRTADLDLEFLKHRDTPLRILLAEDTAMIQKLIRHVLEKRGLDVTLASTGREAVSMLESSDFDVVLMDMHMPEMDGDEAAKVIRTRELSTGRRVPIIAVTAGVLDADKERCLAAGMDDYVSKPIDTKDLLQKIAKHSGKISSSTQHNLPELRADSELV